MGDARACRPTGLVLPLGRDRVEGRLHFAVCTVATEDPSVRRTGKQDVRAVVGSRVCTQAGEQVDCAFDAPQKQAFLCKSTLRIRTNGPRNARRCEGNEKIGKKRGLDDFGRCSVGLGLFATNPGDQCINIAEGCHVCGDDPQGCVDCGVCAVQLLGECQSCIVDSRGGHDDGCATGKKLTDDCSRNRVGGSAGHKSDISGEAAFSCLKSSLGDAGEVVLETCIRGVGAVPLCQFAQRLSCAA